MGWGTNVERDKNRTKNGNTDEGRTEHRTERDRVPRRRLGC